MAGTSPEPDYDTSIQIESPHTHVTQTGTASYMVPQCSLVTICKELAKAKQLNCQLRKKYSSDATKMYQVVTRPVIIPKVMPTETHLIGKKTVWFMTKPTNNNHIKKVTFNIKTYSNNSCHWWARQRWGSCFNGWWWGYFNWGWNWISFPRYLPQRKS